MKTAISIRLDEDLLLFFKKTYPSGYQCEVSRILRDYMEHSIQKAHFGLGRAQEIFKSYYAQCFWHLRADLKITPELLPMVIAHLRIYGGKKGFLLAHELDNLLE